MPALFPTAPASAGGPTPADEQLMWRVQAQDDPEAFARLVRHWEGPIQRLCARLTGDPARGEDLAQEVFARLFARRKAYQPAAKFSTYLWRMALNLCYDDLRRTGRRRETAFAFEPGEEAGEPNVLASADPAPDEALRRREAGDAVQQALAALPEHQRTLVVLRHYEGLKFREIAEVLDLPEGTVKTRMAEALNHLGRLLTRALELEPRAAVPPRPASPTLTLL